MVNPRPGCEPTLIACIGGGSNAMGLFHPFWTMKASRSLASRRSATFDSNAHVTLTGGRPGVRNNRTHGGGRRWPDRRGAFDFRRFDYPGIGPEHAWLHESGRVRYESATDTEALEAFALCSRLEGIIPALEPSHALAYAGKILPDLPPDHIVVMNMCGRGDKDLEAVLPRLEDMGLLAP